MKIIPKRNPRVAIAVAALALPGVLLADSITPAAVSASLEVGESVSIRKIVTVATEAASSTKVDVFFLADTTGSMGPYINAVKASAADILVQVAGLGDVAFAVGDYRDFPIGPWGGNQDYPYKLGQAMTTSQPAAAAAINSWALGWGNDFPESNLAALEALAQSAADPTGWRAGSERILVWFGDAPGHDPDTTPGYPGPTEADATAALLAQGIQVLALDNGNLNSTGQAGRITSATGGTLYSGINSGNIVDQIQDAIEAAFNTYTSVAIDTSEVPLGVAVSVSPGSYVGDWDRSVERQFEFDVIFTGEVPGSYEFALYATVDGGRVATELDSIRVTRTDGGSVPDGGATLWLLGLAVAGLIRIRGR